MMIFKKQICTAQFGQWRDLLFLTSQHMLPSVANYSTLIFPDGLTAFGNYFPREM